MQKQKSTDAMTVDPAPQPQTPRVDSKHVINVVSGAAVAIATQVLGVQTVIERRPTNAHITLQVQHNLSQS
jgi:hypothetical protein